MRSPVRGTSSIHEYFRIDVELAWEMVKHDVPELAERVGEILSGLEGG